VSRPRRIATNLVGLEEASRETVPTQPPTNGRASLCSPLDMEPLEANGANVPRGTSAGFAIGSRLRTVPLDSIDPNERQPRKRWHAQALEALAGSIKARGILQPPVVREVGERYELVAGERRCRAAKLAGLVEIEVLVGDHDSVTSLQDALMENVDRENLTPIETARAYASLTRDLGVTHEVLADRVGASRVTVTNYMRLLDLPDVAIDWIDAGTLSFAHGRELGACADHVERGRLAALAVEKDWSSRQLAAVIGAAKARATAKATRNGEAVNYEPAVDAMALATQVADGLDRKTGMEWKGALLKGGKVRVTAKGGKIAIITKDADTMRELALTLDVSADELTT
jgi:ParB family chromosome partitioning protein